MPDKHPALVSEAGKQVQPHPHDTGSQANETTDGSDSTTEALRRRPPMTGFENHSGLF